MHKVLIVDDLTSDIKLVMECLKADYQLSAATSGEKAIEMAAQNMPDVILMDVSMPTMSGYDACKCILKQQHTNIIFLSANDSTDEILRGYDAGGIDYLIKPFDPRILKEKIQYAIDREAKKNKKTTTKSANLITDINWLSQFVKKAKTFNHPQELVDSIVQACEQLSLAVCVQCHSENGIIESGYQGSLSKLESEILIRQLQEEGNFFETAQGLFITHESIALLVKNPPESFEALEQVKIAFKCLVETADTLLYQLDKINQTSDSPAPTVPSTYNQVSLSLIDDLLRTLSNQSNKKEAGVHLLESVLANIEESFVNMGLTFNQEQALLSILHKGIDESVSQYEITVAEDQSIQEKIHHIQMHLRSE